MKVSILQDKVVVSTNRYVRLRVKISKQETTLVCPWDFDELIDGLVGVSVGAESFTMNDMTLEKQLKELGLINHTARGSCHASPLLRRHADTLKEAFHKRQNRIWDLPEYQ